MEILYPGFWDKNGLIKIEVATIDRCEGRFKAKGLKEFSRNFHDLENSNYLASYFQTHFHKYLSFVNTGNRKSRIIQKHVIDWGFFKSSIILKEKEVIETKAPQIRIKMLLRTLWEESRAEKNPIILYVAGLIGQKYDLLPWCFQRIPIWKRKIRS